MGVDVIFSWLMGVELSGAFAEIRRERIGVEVLDSSGVDSVLFFRDRGPCILLYYFNWQLGFYIIFKKILLTYIFKSFI